PAIQHDRHRKCVGLQWHGGAGRNWLIDAGHLSFITEYMDMHTCRTGNTCLSSSRDLRLGRWFLMVMVMAVGLAACSREQTEPEVPVAAGLPRYASAISLAGHVDKGDGSR